MAVAAERGIKLVVWTTSMAGKVGVGADWCA